MPGLRGASGEGRLIYMIDADGSVVYLGWIYTHDEFPTRQINHSDNWSKKHSRKLKNTLGTKSSFFAGEIAPCSA
jgi:hypothetical protein